MDPTLKPSKPNVRDLLISAYGRTFRYIPTPIRRLLRLFAEKSGLKAASREPAAKSVSSFYSSLNLIKKGDLVFDVGANIGIYSQAFLSLGCRVVAIEPQPNCVEEIRRSISNSNFSCECVGVGSSEGTLDLFVSSSGSNVASTFSQKHKELEETNNKTDYTGTVRVPITTLDLLIKKYGAPAYIKIDVEGFEKEVLAGLSSPVRFLSFEFHSSSLQDAEDCIGILEKKGFRNFNLVHDGRDAFVFPSWESGAEVLAYIKNNRKNFAAGDIFASTK